MYVELLLLVVELNATGEDEEDEAEFVVVVTRRFCRLQVIMVM